MVKKKRTPQPVPFPLRMSDALRKKVDALAKADRRSLNIYLVMVIEAHVAAVEAKPQK